MNRGADPVAPGWFDRPADVGHPHVDSRRASIPRAESVARYAGLVIGVGTQEDHVGTLIVV
jgi:hypothetical protein